MEDEIEEFVWHDYNGNSYVVWGFVWYGWNGEREVYLKQERLIRPRAKITKEDIYAI